MQDFKALTMIVIFVGTFAFGPTATNDTAVSNLAGQTFTVAGSAGITI